MLSTLPYDKALHAVAGSMLALAGALLALLCGLSIFVGAMALPLIFGIGKELRDRWAKAGTPDVWDAVATAAGALPTIIVAALSGVTT
jgi:hypothetical protein